MHFFTQIVFVFDNIINMKLLKKKTISSGFHQSAQDKKCFWTKTLKK